MIRHRKALALTLAMAPACAFAGDGIARADVCSASPDGVETANPVALVYAALKSGGPTSDGIFDVDMDSDESAQERLLGLLDIEYCTTAGKARCGPGDQQKLRDANFELQTFLDSNVRVETIAAPSPTDLVDRPLLEHPDYGDRAKALDEKRRFVRLVCLAADSGEIRPTASKQDKKRLAFADRLRLSGTIEGLGLPRGTPKQLAVVPQADVSYVDNRQNDVQTFNIAAVAGHEFSQDPNRTFIPFLGVKQKRIKKADTPPGTQDPGDISKWSVGFLFGADFDESLDQVSIAPVYVIDDQDDSRVFALRASWTPGFLYSIDKLPFEEANDFGPVYLKFGLQVLAQAGRVVDAGTNAELAMQDDYFRIGPAARMYLWPRTENVFLSKLSADASYKYLRDFSDSRNVIWSDVGINYSVDPSDHVTLRYSYERGRDEETLEETKEWKVSVGVKF